VVALGPVMGPKAGKEKKEKEKRKIYIFITTLGFPPKKK
jgi:hypothetical protein